MKRIWFNHWFSTAYNIIEMLKKDNPSYYVIASNEADRSLISLVADEWYKEPSLKGDAYIEFCLSFCSEHKIDVFIPRREMVNISKSKAKFEELGTKVIVEEFEYMSILNQKDVAYTYLKDKGVTTIPDYRVVKNVNDFISAYDELGLDYKEICFKFVHDEGGKSYRLIDNDRKGYSALFKKQNTRMTYDSVISALSERDSFPSLMVMPYLPGNEISVDCLKTESGIIMLPRVKDPTRMERMSYDDFILDITKEIYDIFPLEWPSNVQFKYLNGKPYFLEVNTRMSGGVQMACLASGVNIPSIAVRKILGEDTSWCINKTEYYVTHIERPIVVQ